MKNYSFTVIEGGYDSNFTYLIGDPESKELAFIDCAERFEILEKHLKIAFDQGYTKLSKVFVTHGHHDHVMSLKEIKEKYNPTIYCHMAEYERLIKQNKVEIDEFIEDRQILSLGKQELKTFHTPGHQASSICFVWQNKLFTGDTLFVGACGRHDLPGGNANELLESLKFLATTDELSGDLEVRSGHNYGFKPYTNLAYERKNNPHLIGFKHK